MKLTTIEMLNELFKHPEKKFKSIDGPTEIIAKIDLDDDQELYSLKFSNDYGTPTAILINRTWEEVKQPVSVMEAMASFESGRDIVCLFKDEEIKFSGNRNSDRRGRKVYDDNCRTITAKMILEGTWYIL